MKILFVCDRLELKHFEYNKLVTDFWLIKEFLDRGKDVFITSIDKLGIKTNDSVEAFSKCAKAYIQQENIFFEKEFNYQKIDNFDLVMFRPDPPVDVDYLNATYVFDFVDRTKTVVLNEPSAIRDFNEKVHANFFPELLPKNIVTPDKDTILEFLSEEEEVILKPLNECFGSGVMYLKKGDKNVNSIINTLTKNQTTAIMAQKYLKGASHGDKRVFTLGDEVLEECVAKLPSANDFKFSIHNDDYIKKAILTDEEKKDFKKVAKKLHSMGIFMSGLDVIDGKIIEINVTSPCYFIKEVNNYFATNLEKKVVDEIFNFVESKLKSELCV